MARLARALAQLAWYAAFVGVIGYFSVYPVYRHLAPGTAVIKLAFSHAGRYRAECTQLSAEELARLPTNRRRQPDCARERFPLEVELELDGQLVFRGLQQPSGLWKDGQSHVYERFEVAAGRHSLRARLNEGPRVGGGFDYAAEREIELAAGQNFVIGFRAAGGGFSFD